MWEVNPARDLTTLHQYGALNAGGGAAVAASADPGLRLFVSILDHVDYGALVTSAEGWIWHANAAALVAIDASCALQCVGGQVRARYSCDVAPLYKAITASADRGMQGMVALGSEGGSPIEVAVLPLPAIDGQGAALLLLGRQSLSEALSLGWYSRVHKLTSTESRVLEALCTGHQPAHIASSHRVRITTVRTQINSIRRKTGAANIRDLLDRIARLPPMASTLRSRSSAATMSRWPIPAKEMRPTLIS